MNFSSLGITIPIMIKGMLGILIVSAVIIAVTVILSKATKEDK